MDGWRNKEDPGGADQGKRSSKAVGGGLGILAIKSGNTAIKPKDRRSTVARKNGIKVIKQEKDRTRDAGQVVKAMGEPGGDLSDLMGWAGHRARPKREAGGAPKWKAETAI